MNFALQNDDFLPQRLAIVPISFKAHRVTGFSPETIEQHYENIYGGAIQLVNDINARLATLRSRVGDTQEISALKAQELKATNEIVLHETYFNGLGEDGGEQLAHRGLIEALDVDCGGIDQWKDEMRLLVRGWSGGSGWVALFWNHRSARLATVAVVAGDGVSGASPILALDMGEHAFASDFGSDRMSYVEAYINSIHWGRVAARFEAAQGIPAQSVPETLDENQITVEDLMDRIDRNDQSLLVFDVRHEDDRERYKPCIMETAWRDSFDVAGWADECPPEKTIVVYCMYGFWVSQKVAEELRQRGLNARSLAGGIAAWRGMGFPSTDAPDASAR